MSCELLEGAPQGHLAALTRNQVRFAGAATTVPMLTDPAPAQRQTFELFGTPIPLTLKQTNKRGHPGRKPRPNPQPPAQPAVTSG